MLWLFLQLFSRNQYQPVKFHKITETTVRFQIVAVSRTYRFTDTKSQNLALCSSDRVPLILHFGPERVYLLIYIHIYIYKYIYTYIYIYIFENKDVSTYK